jgi:hypothetical protein
MASFDITPDLVWIVVAFMWVILGVIVVFTFLTLQRYIERRKVMVLDLTLFLIFGAGCVLFSSFLDIPAISLPIENDLTNLCILLGAAVFLEFTLRIFFDLGPRQKWIVILYAAVGLIPVGFMFALRGTSEPVQVYKLSFSGLVAIPELLLFILAARLHGRVDADARHRFTAILVSGLLFLAQAVLFELNQVFKSTVDGVTWFYVAGWICTLLTGYFLYNGFIRKDAVKPSG